ncbi:unnamed protein product, partial [Symbiodinium pilosum]
MGLGAIQSSSSLSFVFNTSEFLGIESSSPSLQAYLENTSTMKWVKVDADYDGVADTWQGLFGSDVTPEMLCDGIHDGHAVVTDQGITEALVSAKEQNMSLMLLVRDITGAQVGNFEIREDPDACWQVDDSMVAT